MCLEQFEMVMDSKIFTFKNYLIGIKDAYINSDGGWVPFFMSNMQSYIDFAYHPDGLITKRNITNQKIIMYDACLNLKESDNMELGYHISMFGININIVREALQVQLPGPNLRAIAIPVLIDPTEIQAVGTHDIVAERFIIPSPDNMSIILNAPKLCKEYNELYKVLHTYYTGKNRRRRNHDKK